MTTLLGLTECNHSKIRWVEQNNKELRIKHLDIVFDTYLKIYHKKKATNWWPFLMKSETIQRFCGTPVDRNTSQILYQF